MRRLELDATDVEILGCVREWVGLLVHEKYAEALAHVEAGSHWTPELLRRVIAGYGSPEPRADGCVYRVTPLESARGSTSPRHEVEWSGTRGWVWFDLPLNGEWSDLMVMFDIERRDGYMALVLDDVHVH